MATHTHPNEPHRRSNSSQEGRFGRLDVRYGPRGDELRGEDEEDAGEKAGGAAHPAALRDELIRRRAIARDEGLFLPEDVVHPFPPPRRRLVFSPVRAAASCLSASSPDRYISTQESSNLVYNGRRREPAAGDADLFLPENAALPYLPPRRRLAGVDGNITHGSAATAAAAGGAGGGGAPISGDRAAAWKKRCDELEAKIDRRRWEAERTRRRIWLMAAAAVLPSRRCWSPAAAGGYFNFLMFGSPMHPNVSGLCC